MNYDQNPRYVFQTTSSDILKAIMSGEVDPIEIASIELANRGLAANGEYVGLEKARKEHIQRMKLR